VVGQNNDQILDISPLVTITKQEYLRLTRMSAYWKDQHKQAILREEILKKTIEEQKAKAGLTPATQIKVSGYSGMALAHSRGTSCAAPRCVPRITVVVIRSAPNAAMSQARTS